MSSRFLFKQLCEELSADSCPAELNLMFLKPILFAGRSEASRVNMLVLRTSIFHAQLSDRLLRGIDTIVFIVTVHH